MPDLYPLTRACSSRALKEGPVRNRGVVVELIAGDFDPDRLGDEDLAAPHLIDSEVTNVLRGLVLRGVLTDAQGAIALDGFARLSNVSGIRCTVQRL